MKPPARQLRREEPVVVLVALLTVMALFGGASRADVLAQVVVRLAAVLAGAWSLSRLDRSQLAGLRVPLSLLLALVALMAFQLIPLPPSWWTGLPGREPFVGLAALAGAEQPWRPLSLTPEATRNALFAVLAPLGVLLAAARIAPARLTTVVIAVLVLGGISALLGLLQVTGRAPALYLYRITNEGSAVGLFANRNHQAALLAAMLPALAAVALRDEGEATARTRRRVVAACAAVFLAPLILITGSRAGLLLMLVGGVGAWFLYLAHRRETAARARRHGRRAGRLLLVGTVAVAGLLVALTILLSRAEAVQRLFSQDVAQEARVRLFGAILEIGRVYAPWGAGFGSFDPVFRFHEPFSNLNPRYLNHAHNDALELWIEGGVPAVALLLIYGVWIVRRSVAAWRRGRGGDAGGRTLARAGSVMLLMLLLASLGDYPLRTPMLAAVAALATVMLARSPATPRGPK